MRHKIYIILEKNTFIYLWRNFYFLFLSLEKAVRNSPPPPMPPYVLSDFVVSSPRLWLKCNRILRLGRPVGAVTLSRWEWWWNERWIWGARRALNLISTNYPDHGHHGRLPLSRKNAQGIAGNRTRDLMISSQEVWPTSHEAGQAIRKLNRRILSLLKYLNVTVSILMCLKIRYKDYISQTYPVYFSC